LDLLEGYFSSHKFFNNEKNTFRLLKSLPHVTHCEQNFGDGSREYEIKPMGGILSMLLRSITFFETMTTSIQDGQPYTMVRTKPCHSTQIPSTSYMINWVSRTMSDTWFSNIEADYIDISKQKCTFWTCISSLGVAYHYVVKIEENLQQKGKKDFGVNDKPQQKKGKGHLNSLNKGHRKNNCYKSQVFCISKQT